MVLILEARSQRAWKNSRNSQSIQLMTRDLLSELVQKHPHSHHHSSLLVNIDWTEKMQFHLHLVLASTFLLPLLTLGQHLACDNRKPEGHNPQGKREGDGGFSIVVNGPLASGGFYAPNEVYTGNEPYE